MRRHAAIALILVLASAAAAPAQEWARKMFSEQSHDFGVVAKGSKTQYRFKFKNIYVEPAHISGVRSSCSCTLPEVTKPELKTWETGEVVATFNTNAFLGQHSATITVTFDKPFPAEVQLQINGNIRGDVVLQPGMVELGTVDAGRTAEKKISLSHSGRSDWTISDVRSANTNFEVEVNEVSRSPSTVAYDLIVRLKPTSPVGYINDQLFLMTNDPAAPQIPVDVEGRVISDITVNPSSLSLGVVAPGQTVTKKVVVRSKRAFRVLGIDCDKSFTCEVPEASREVQMIPITFTAGQQPGKVTQKIKIKTDLGANVVPDITCQVTVAAESPDAPAASTGNAAAGQSNTDATHTGFRGK